MTHRRAASQALEWVDLQGLATSAMPLASGARMRFPATYAPRIVGLVEREAACCSFLDIVTSREGDQLVVEITTESPEAVGLIGLLAGVAPS